MTGRERILSALRREPTDRRPVGSILTVVTHEMMEKVGAYWPQAHQYAADMAKLACAAHTVCGFDSVKLPFDMTVEHEALGGVVDFGDISILPQAKHLYEWGEMPNIPPDLLQKGRIPMVLDAIGIAKKLVGENAAVVTSVVGPFALATKLYGAEDVLIASITEPELLYDTLAAITNVVAAYAKAQRDAGSDVVLIGDPATSGDLISSECYAKHVLPHHKRLISEIKTPAVLHVCGNINGHLTHLAQTGAAGISFDFKTDAAIAREALAGKAALIGWVDPLDVLLRGDEKAAYEASLDCIKNGVDILTPGCAISAHTPLANLLAMRRAVDNT